jgi:hypothetical protein
MTQAFNLSQLANNLDSSGRLDATDGLVNAVPVANGGTGASSADAARTNLSVPTRTGGDASGTWSINISGNANTATNATNATNAINATNAGNASTVTNGVYTTNFTGSNQSLSANGYQKLPGGLIIQWGSFTTNSAAANLPTPFPNAALSACATNVTSVASVDNPVLAVFSTTQIRFTQVGSNSVVNYIAIGY